MDLAEHIAKANMDNRPNDVDVDELGLPIRDDSIDYFAARAIKINADTIADGHNTGLLHHRGDMLYVGNAEVERNKVSITRLCKPARKLHGWEIERIYDSLLRHTPYFDPTKLMVTDTLYWDIEKGCLVETDEPILPVL